MNSSESESTNSRSWRPIEEVACEWSSLSLGKEVREQRRHQQGLSEHLFGVVETSYALEEVLRGELVEEVGGGEHSLLLWQIDLRVEFEHLNNHQSKLDLFLDEISKKGNFKLINFQDTFGDPFFSSQNLSSREITPL